MCFNVGSSKSVSEVASFLKVYKFCDLPIFNIRTLSSRSFPLWKPTNPLNSLLTKSLFDIYLELFLVYSMHDMHSLLILLKHGLLLLLFVCVINLFFKSVNGVMVNFMYLFNWAKGSPDCREIISGSVIRVFLEKISIK